SFGGGKIDENCAILEAAAKAPNRLAFCKIYVSNKYVKKAGVTLEDCLQQPVQPVAEVAPVAPAPVVPSTQVVVLPPANISVAPTLLPIPAPVAPVVVTKKRRKVSHTCPAVPAAKGL